MRTVTETEINELFDKYSNNMASVLSYIQYYKDLQNYSQNGNRAYKMLPYINYAVYVTFLLKLYGFFDTGKKGNVPYGLPLKMFLDAVKDSQFDKEGAVASLEAELKSFEDANATIQTSIRTLRNIVGHVNPTDNPPNITLEEIEATIKWIRCFIDKLGNLCGKGSFGVLYKTPHGGIIGEIKMPVVIKKHDVLDVLVENQV